METEKKLEKAKVLCTRTRTTSLVADETWHVEITAVGAKEGYTVQQVAEECLYFGGDGSLDYEELHEALNICNGKTVIATARLERQDIVDEIEEDEQVDLDCIKEIEPKLKLKR